MPNLEIEAKEKVGCGKSCKKRQKAERAQLNGGELNASLEWEKNGTLSEQCAIWQTPPARQTSSSPLILINWLAAGDGHWRGADKSTLVVVVIISC